MSEFLAALLVASAALGLVSGLIWVRGNAKTEDPVHNVVLEFACVDVGGGWTRCQNTEMTCYLWNGSPTCVKSGAILHSTTDNDDDN